MAAQQRTEKEHETDYIKIARWYQQGWTHWRMTEELNKDYAASGRSVNIGRRQVSSDVAEVVRRWRERAATDVGQRMAEELARVDRVEAAAWESWERSLEASKTVTARQGGGMVQTIKNTSGDPRFLDTVLKCVEQRAKFLGLYAAEKRTVELKGMSDDDLIARLQAGFVELGLVASGSEKEETEPGEEST